MSQSLSTSEWMDALNGTMNEIASTALGLEGSAHVRTSACIPTGLEGAYLALVGEQDSIQIGLASSAEGCQILAKAMLGMEPGDEDLPAGDLADAVCEIVNILAGGVKGRVHGKVPPIKIGIPIFVHGNVQSSDRTVLAVAEVVVGRVPAALVLVEPRSGASPLPTC
jgi:CheY-specific phosphatase CheX